MTFQIHALDPTEFIPLFELDDAALVGRGARRVTATSSPGFPCRVSLEDAGIGETLLLVNHAHLTGETPYAATHAVYIRQNAPVAVPEAGKIPIVLTRRLLSVRGFDRDRMMIDAEIVDGAQLAPHLEALFARDAIDFVHLHYARPGCFAAAVTRA
ncbi:MAG: DUF1203 domain-containing protein [Sandarakinorhabdus sp.]|nr:DUF1203 domain-containing protein [Sandarakinorhabdus sp.]